MGMYRPDFYLSRHFIEEYCRIEGKGYSDINIVELGNQIINYEVRQSLGINTGHIAKNYFTSLGCNHISIDINGEDGALPIDLGSDFSKANLINRFDILTNHGTTEHVETDQYKCWENIHNLVKKNGIYIHFLPKAYEFCPTHCNWFYTEDFFIYISERLGYKVLFNSEIVYPEKEHGTILGFVFKKEKEYPFNNVDKEVFYSKLLWSETI